MPVSMEQWRAAVGAWNITLSAAIPRGIINKRLTFTGTQKEKVKLNLRLVLHLHLLIIAATIIFREGIYGYLSGRSTAFDDTVIFIIWDFFSLVSRRLLIISGDVELNPGPGKTYIISVW